MNRADKNLLDDVLAENSDFRAALLAETLRRARRRRHVRQAQRTTGFLFVAILAGYFLWQNPKPTNSMAVAKRISSPPVTKKISPPYQLVRTESLLENEIVTTKSSAVQWIASSANVVEIETMPNNFRRINDAELLALAANHPAILIRTGPNSEKLIFANPADEKSAPIN